jgi:serine/threonine protein kinase
VITGLVFGRTFQRKHNGIKPSNILWKKDGSYCLNDFGISKVYHATWPKEAPFLTLDYSAPEVLAGE